METWRDVVGYEGLYSVSDHGRVRSEARVVRSKLGVTRRIRGKILKAPANSDGYPKVSLCRDGGRRDGVVHLLVLTAFRGPKPEPKHEGCHNDGNPANNRLENLRWDSMINNQRDRLRHGTDLRGEKCGTSRFTSAQVRLIRSLKGEMSNRELATVFGCSKSGIGLIQCRRSWAHL